MKNGGVLPLVVAFSTLSVVDSQRSLIVGGEIVLAEEYPYFVDVGTCGGSLVAPDVVLSTAHCGSLLNKQVIVNAFWSDRDIGNAQSRFCDEWIPDPLFSTAPPKNYSHDFALCKLDAPVTFDNSSGTVPRIVLNADPAVPVSGDELVVMGMGSDEADETEIGKLHDVTVNYINNTECNQNGIFFGVIEDVMMCAGDLVDGGRDACDGDSGAPLIQTTAGSPLHVQVGVVSWGVGCGIPDKPGVYSRISERFGWLNETICGTLESVADYCNNPAPPPSSGCAVDEDTLTIDLLTDDRATQISWTLENTNGDEVLTRQYLIEDYQNTHEVCLPRDQCYIWTLRDSGGTGFYGGSYALTLHGEPVPFASGNGGDVGSETIVRFCPANATATLNPTPAPSGAPTLACEEHLQYKFTIQMGNVANPGALRALISIQFVGVYGFPEVFPANTNTTVLVWESYFCLWENREFGFAMQDPTGNIQTVGLLSYEGYLGDQQIFQGDVDFVANSIPKRTIWKVFTPNAPSASPSATPSVAPSALPSWSPSFVPSQSNASPDDPPDNSPPLFPQIGPEDCPGDMLLVKHTGVTAYADQAVQIVNQTTTASVTVQLNNTWNPPGTLGTVFYQYKFNAFSNECRKVNNFSASGPVEVTITCSLTSQVAILEVWIADAGFLSPEDDAIIPGCCNPTLPAGTPATRYLIEIKCASQCEGASG